MRSVGLALAAGLVLLVAALVAVLGRAPLTSAGGNQVAAPFPVAETSGRTSSGQFARLPRATTGIRVSLAAKAGPRLRLRVYSGRRLLSQGERPAGWGLEANVIVPLRALPHAIPHALICLALGPAPEPVLVLGTPTQRTSGRSLDFKHVKLRFEYLRRGSQPWFSRASSVAYHMGLGHAFGGAWLAVFVLLVMLCVSALAARLTLRELR